MKKTKLPEIKDAVLKIKNLKPAKYNPRTISDFEFQELLKSMQKFGQTENIVVNKDMTIISGHQRVKAAKELGWTEIKANIVDLTKKEEKILNVAMNAVRGEFVEDMLADLIYEIREDMIGFSEEQVNQYIMQRELREDSAQSYEPDDDEELKKILDNNERIAVRVKEPEEAVRKDQLAFYVETYEEYIKIRDFFSTSRKGELDKDKLLTLF